MNRNRAAGLVAVGLLAAAQVDCGGEEPASGKGDQTAHDAVSSSVVRVGQLGRPMAVPARANIFGAGHREPPAPGGGGPGVLPPVWRLPDGAQRAVSFTRATGRVIPIAGVSDANGPAGDGIGGTDVSSYGGISGIVHRHNGMFLVGVFLTDDPPSKHAPPILDFTERNRFRSLAPRVGQTFLVGDGRGRTYRVPPGATRLFLGFADAYHYQGPPGWYDNNAGQLTVTVEVAKR